jgi:hypothetical protein
MCPSLRANKPDEGDVFNALQNGTPVGMPSFAALLAPPDMQDLCTDSGAAGSCVASGQSNR